MAKPGTLPRWATDLTNNDAPSSTQMDTGWTPGQIGVSDYDNWKSYWSYKWLEWLNGIFGADDSLEVSRVYETDQMEYGQHPSAFQTLLYSTTAEYRGWYWTFTGATTLYAPLTCLRAGDTIVSAGWSYDRNSVGTITAALVRRSLPGGIGGDSVIQSDDDTTSGAAAVEVVYNYNHVVESGYAYGLRIGFDDAAHIFLGARVFVTRPRP